jgi:hypothetical protein
VHPYRGDASDQMAVYVKRLVPLYRDVQAMHSTARTTLTLLCRRTTLRKFTVDRQCVLRGFATQRRQVLKATLNPRLAPWSQSTRPLTSQSADGAHTLDPREDNRPVTYHGPLAQTFRRLKIFSLATLGLTCTMAPFLFIVESSLPMSARVFLTATAISTSTISTALVSWCGAPYVVDLRRLTPAENGGIEGIEMTTLTLTLKKLTTRVYDADFLVETNRPFAKWELPLAIQLPPSDEDNTAAGKAGAPGEEETVAETLNDRGEVIGRWIVKWGEGGTGSCRGTGTVLR